MFADSISIGCCPPLSPCSCVPCVCITVPSAAPVDVRAAALDSRSIKVTWNPPPVDKHNGKITKYVINYQKVLDVKEVRSENHSNSYTSLSSLSSLHPSLSSSSLSPVNEIVKPTSSVTRVDDHNEVEDDYDLDARSSRVREETADPESRSHVIRNLEEWTTYRITVSAATMIGPGPPSPDLLVRTDEFGMFLSFLFGFVLEYSLLPSVHPSCSRVPLSLTSFLIHGDVSANSDVQYGILFPVTHLSLLLFISITPCLCCYISP